MKTSVLIFICILFGVLCISIISIHSWALADQMAKQDQKLAASYVVADSLRHELHEMQTQKVQFEGWYRDCYVTRTNLVDSLWELHRRYKFKVNR